MTTTATTTTTEPTARRRTVRRRLAAGAVTLAVTGGIGVAAAPAASASAPSYLPSYGTSATFPTWVWGSTGVCAQNHSGYRSASATIKAGSAASETFYVAPGSTSCISRWFGGATLKVTNTGSSAITVWTY